MLLPLLVVVAVLLLVVAVLALVVALQRILRVVFLLSVLAALLLF